MKKNRVYVINEEQKNSVLKSSIIEFILGIFIYAIILLIVNSTFKGFYVENFWWALLAAFIISLLNSSIKPFLIYLTLPLTVSTLGIFYPVVNLIILKIAGLLLSNHLEVKGFWIPFLIAIFISILRLVFDSLIIKPIMRKIK